MLSILRVRSQSSTKMLPKNTQKGFTLIELLVVISVVAALAGILIGVLDPQKQKQTGEDGAKRATLNEYTTSIESYRTAEGSYPLEGDDNNPLNNDTTGEVAAIYISEWLPGYVYNSDVTGSEFSVHIQKSIDQGYFKYTSAWKEIRECGETTDPNSITACD
jgi:prepilin-type N-terminal cleavage/methylation domain-containing protein